MNRKATQKVREINFVFLLTIFVYIICSTVISFIQNHIQINKVVLVLVSQGVLILPTIGYVIYNKENILELIRFKKVCITNVILLVLFTFFIMPFINLVNAISMLFATNFTDETVTSIVSNYPLAIGIITIAFIPAILEESVYRGVFYNEYRKENILKGILLSGLLFGMLHMNLNQFSYAFVMGIIFAFVIEATDSILSTMIIHFVTNATSVILVYLMPKIIEFANNNSTGTKVQNVVNSNDMTRQELMQSVISLAEIAAVMTPIAFFLYFAIAKKAGRWEQVLGIFKTKSEKDSKVRMLTLPLGIAFAVCVLFMVVGEFVQK